MKLIYFILITMMCFSSLAYGKSSDDDNNEDLPTCITAERIIKPTITWKILKTEVTYQNQIPFLEINLHNPLNKDVSDFVDAKLTLILNPNMPFLPQKGELIMAVFFNNKTTVTFKRIFTIQNVSIKNKTKKMPVETRCFHRDVVEIINFDETESLLPDGGTD